MQSRFIILLLILPVAQLFAQTSNTVSLVYGTTTTNIATYGTDQYNYVIKSGPMYGVTYFGRISKWFSMGGGVFFVDNKSLITPVVGGPSGVNPNGEVKMLSFPVYARFTFFKYIFIEAGLSADSQTNYKEDQVMFEQSGICTEVGFGAKYNFRRVTLSINPFLADHYESIFNSKSNNKLEEKGLKFGIGYGF